MQIVPADSSRANLPPETEWFSMQLFRQTINLYLNIFKMLSMDRMQKIFASCSLFSVLGVGIACFAIYMIYIELPTRILSMICILEINVLLLLGVYSYSVKVFYDNEEQKLATVFLAMILSITIFIFSAIFMGFLQKDGFYYCFVGVLAVSLFNLMSIYYALWLGCALLLGLCFFLEFIIRIVTCSMKRIYNPAIQLPLILYPNLPGVHFTKINGQAIVYNNTNSTVKICMICLDHFSCGQNLRQLKCHADHIFHANCLEQWLNVKKACPLCRAFILNSEV